MASLATSLLIACAIVGSLPAHAQSVHATAVAEFDKGRALLKKGDYEGACVAFNASQKLEPANGTLFNIAECSERLGKLATAWLAYRDLARDDSNAGRKQESAKRAKALEKRVPKLLVRVDVRPNGLAVTIDERDATPLVGIESPVDAGKYTIRATAPDHDPFEITVSVTEGKTTKVDLELDERMQDGTIKPKKKKPPVEEQPAVATSHRVRNGVLVGITGGVVLAVGGVFGLRAQSASSEADELCPGRTCVNAADKARGDELLAEARTNATRSTVFVLSGAVIAAAGIYLIVSGRSTSSRTAAIHLAPARDGAAVVLGGRF
jgi:hypothetical protein